MAPPRPLETLFEEERLEEPRLRELFPEPTLVERLLRLGILRGESDGTVKVRFVGVAIAGGRSFQIVPKVLAGRGGDSTDAMRQVVRALRRYARWKPPHHEDAPFLRADQRRPELSAIAIADWLLRDYLALGLYRRLREREELDGPGQVSWRRTIERIDPLILRGRPVYPNVVTRSASRDSDHFVSRLHRHAVERTAADFGHLLGYGAISLDHEPFEPFAETPPAALCHARIGQELRDAYSDRALQLLPMLRAWLTAQQAPARLALALYGTTTFYTVWEAACASALGNEVEAWQDEIPRPKWVGSGGDVTLAKTWRPDVVTPLAEAGAGALLIADAKYYDLSMPPLLAGQPGVNDVAKQIWYEQCLAGPAKARGFGRIGNIFVVPGPDGGPSLAADGHVELGVLGGGCVGIARLAFVEALERYAEGRPLADGLVAQAAGLGEASLLAPELAEPLMG